MFRCGPETGISGTWKGGGFRMDNGCSSFDRSGVSCWYFVIYSLGTGRWGIAGGHPDGEGRLFCNNG